MREYFCLYTTSKWVYYHVIAYLTGGCKPYNVSNLLVTPLIKGGTRNVWRGTQNTRRHFCSLFFCWTFSYLISKGNPDYRIFFSVTLLKPSFSVSIWFPCEWLPRSEARNSLRKARHYQNLGRSVLPTGWKFASYNHWRQEISAVSQTFKPQYNWAIIHQYRLF